MRRAIIHIGTTKTGTTSIQRTLKRHRGEMAAHGACYPRSPGRAAHMLLCFAVANWTRVKMRREDSASERSVGNRLADFRASLDTEMAALPDSVNRVIFSEERLSMLLNKTTEIEALKELLSPYFQSFTIVVYLRSQDSYLASRYAELLKSGAITVPDHQAPTAKRLRNYDYGALIDRWAAVFGADAIEPRLYERGANRAFDSVTDFMSVCGLDIAMPENDPLRNKNQSMSFAGQQILLRLGTMMEAASDTGHVDRDVWREVTMTVSRALPGQGWLPTRDEAAAFMARFAAGNEAIRQRYFPERPALFADEQARFPLLPMQVSDTELVDAACQAFQESVMRNLASRKVAERTAPGGARRGATEEDLEEDESETEDDP
jgi:hypothetical protein